MMERMIEKSVIVPAAIQPVWDAWTTSEGAQTFFAPRANIELSVGGPYELLFDLDAPVGSQGAEGMRVLSYQRGLSVSVPYSFSARTCSIVCANLTQNLPALKLG